MIFNENTEKEIRYGMKQFSNKLPLLIRKYETENDLIAVSCGFQSIADVKIKCYKFYKNEPKTSKLIIASLIVKLIVTTTLLITMLSLFLPLSKNLILMQIIFFSAIGLLFVKRVELTEIFLFLNKIQPAVPYENVLKQLIRQEFQGWSNLDESLIDHLMSQTY